ncbi:MAG: Rod shape-determining protein RodA, partial [uncultured Gemmatimonadaceae bacterium]
EQRPPAAERDGRLPAHRRRPRPLDVRDRDGVLGRRDRHAERGRRRLEEAARLVRHLPHCRLRRHEVVGAAAGVAHQAALLPLDHPPRRGADPRAGLGRGHGGERQGMAHDRRDAARPARGAGEDRRGADARARAVEPARGAHLAARAVEARAGGGHPLAAHHASARPGHRHRVHRDLLRDAVLVGRPVAPAHPGREPRGEPRARLQPPHLGRVVLPAARAGHQVPRVSVGGGDPRRGERLLRRAGADSVGPPRALPTEATAGLHRPEHRRARLGLPRDPVARGDRLRGDVGEGVDAGHAEAAGLPSRAAHRLHLVGGGRGARLPGRDARTHALSRALSARRAHRHARQRQLQLPRGLRPRLELVRARRRERGDDAQPRPDHRHPAPLLQLRRLVHARELAGRRDAGPHLGRGEGTASTNGRV